MRLPQLALVFASLVLAFAIGPAPHRAYAQGDDARALFARGTEAYHVGSYDEAIEAWERAYALDPRPLLQFNLSQAYERSGRLEDAIAALERYLATTSPDDPARTAAQARLVSMRSRLERTGILVSCETEGATILVDGEERAQTPRTDPIPVTPGNHAVEVRREGYEPFRSEVAVNAGSVATVEATLTPRVAGGASRVGAWALLGGGGAVAVAGGVLGGVGLARARDAEVRDGSDADSARALGRAGDTLLFVGAAAAAGGLVWALVARPRDASEGEESALRLAPTLGVDGAGLSLTGSF